MTLNKIAAALCKGLRAQSLRIEFAFLFLVLPVYLFFHVTRLTISIALWGGAFYVLIIMYGTKIFSWRRLWHGSGWSMAQRKIASLRFCVTTAIVLIFMWAAMPDQMFRFVELRPLIWLMVLALYPILSVIPQELIYRSFFFGRYGLFFSQTGSRIGASAVTFAFAHIVFHNWVSPLACCVGGLFFAHSYSQHQSLKWVILEHAAYGAMIFTVGLGPYFLVGAVRP